MAGNRGNQAVAKRYATALFSLAQEQKVLDSVEKDLQELRSMLADSEELALLVENLVLPREVQLGIVSALAKKANFSKLTARFLGLLATKRRLNVLAGVIDAVAEAIADHRNEVTAEVVSATPLADDQIKSIEEALSKSLNKNVKLELREDADIIGGLVIRVGSKLIDSSVKSKLERLHRSLKTSNTVAETINMREVA